MTKVTVLRTIATVCAKELTDHLRDRRTALMIFMVSIAMGPLMLFGLTYFISSVEEKAEKKEIFIVGKEHAPQLVNFLARQDVTLQEPKPDYRELIKTGKHDAVLLVPKNFQEKFATGAAEVELIYDDSRTDGAASVRGVRSYLRGFNAEAGNQRLIARGVSPLVMRTVDVKDVNMGTAAQRAAQLLFMIPLMSLIVCLTGCTAIAIDMTAGERERGSMEPLLMNPVSRMALATGKWLAVATYGLCVVGLTLAGFALTLKFMPMPRLETVMAITGMQFVGFGATMLSFAPAMGALQMLIATYGRTFKEAQTYVSYLVIIVTQLPLVTILGQVKDASWQLFVPMLGQLMVITRILRGDPVTAMHFGIPLAINVTISVVAVLLIAKLLTKEKIIFGRA
jgi:sodium transport system permease protein